MAKLPAAAKEVTVVLERPGGELAPADVAEFALGLTLRAYAFDRYKTKKKDEDEEEGPSRARITLVCADAAPPRRPGGPASRWPRASSSPAISSTSRRTCCIPRSSPTAPRRWRKLGVEVEVLDDKAMKKLGMGALLGVGQGSRARGARRRHALERRRGAARPSRSPSSARA